MLIIKHVKGLFDCFSGVGYGLHTRVQLHRENGATSLRYVAGQRLPTNVLHHMAQNISLKDHYQTVKEA